MRHIGYAEEHLYLRNVFAERCSEIDLLKVFGCLVVSVEVGFFLFNGRRWDLPILFWSVFQEVNYS